MSRPALHRPVPSRAARAGLLVLVALATASACQREALPPAREDIRALFDVQPEATNAFRAELADRYGAAETPSQTVEAALARDGFECGPDPTRPSERACVREAEDPTDGLCTLISIVRSEPFLPGTAQIVRACSTQPQP